MSRSPAAALFREARAAFDRRDYRRARALCRDLLDRNRRDFDALMLTADVAGRTGTIDEEIGYVTRAVRERPDNADLRVHLGHRHLAAGKLKQALIQFEKAARLDPGLPAAAAGRAMAHEGRNRYDRARRALAPFVRAAATPPIVAAVHLRVLVHDGELDEAIALGRAVVAADHSPSMALRSVWFTLAKACEGRERYDEALAAADDAHRILAEPFDLDRTRRAVDELIDVYTADRLGARPRPTDPGDQPVFIVGMPRSGSTLIERMLHAHPDAAGMGESGAMRAIIHDLSAGAVAGTAYPRCVEALGGDDVDALGARYMELLDPPPRVRRAVDKHLGNYWHLGLINILFPSARIIHSRRDPLDTCLSCFVERLTPTEAPFAGDQRSLGLYYREYLRLMEHWRGVLDMPVLDVDYEGIVRDPETMTRRIIEFCGLDWDEACLRHHEVRRVETTISFDQVRRPIYRTAVGRAARFGALLDPLRRALEGDGGEGTPAGSRSVGQE